MAQCVAVTLLRTKHKGAPGAFLMPLHSQAGLAALLGRLYIAATNGRWYIALAELLVTMGSCIFALRARRESLWPFHPA